MYATQYLDRLGLDHGADERAIKRAYARELKQIDQETDAAGFQVLRHAYEMALDWVRYEAADVSFAPAVAVPELPVAVPDLDVDNRPAAPVPAAPARDADTGESPPLLAQTVFDEFLAICEEMVAQGNSHDSLLWRKHLQRCASDDRLLNITARAHFEFFVARLLADGWRTGHECLFVAARQVFGWDTDRRSLLEFGQLGGWMDQAIDECEMFTHQQSGDCSGQADAVARVREDTAPGTNELINHVPHLRNMVARFPAWTGVIADRARIEQWMALEQAIPKWRRRMRITKAASGTGTSFNLGWWQVVALIIAIRALLSLFGSPPASNQPPSWNPPQLVEPFQRPLTAKEQHEELLYQRAAGSLYMPPGTQKLDPQAQREQAAVVPSPPARPQGRFLNDAETRAISRHIQFEWPETAKGTYKVAFNIELDDRGAITNMTKDASSGLPGLDRAVGDAIRASAPFGKEISRSFWLRFWWRKEPAKQETPAPDRAVPDLATPDQATPDQATPEALE